MRRLISLLPECMKYALNFIIDKALMPERIDSIYGGIVVWRVYMVKVKHQVDNIFAQHPKLDHAGIGVRIDILFSKLPEFC